ncbi:MAG: type II CAAX prenyl endopeptidase Rce1 family protein [Bacteroidota bacterium]
MRSLLYSKNKVRLLVELVLLFAGLPVLLTYNRFGIPLVFILLALGVLIQLFLAGDPEFDRSRFFNWHAFRKEWPTLIIFFVIGALLMTLLTWLINPDQLFLLPRTNPLFLLMISVFYPLFSVVPQGLAYRALFYHRYAVFFPGKWTKILVSAAFFSLGHLLYKNLLVLLLAFIAGILFAWRYQRSESLAVSVIEHSLFGVWLFACGLGMYFVSAFVH